MSNLRQESFDAAGVEALLKAAGGYVGPSEDLRPRVLEEARRLRSGGRGRRRLALAGSSALALVTLIGVQASSLNQSLSESAPSQRVAQLVASSNATGKSTAEGLWSLVDAFFAVRGEQADAFHPVDATGDALPEETSEGVAQMPAADGSF